MVQIRSWFENLTLSKRGLWKAILYPFFLSRLIWEIIACFSAGNFLPNPTYEEFAKRGFFLTRIFPVDIFTRWDSRHYFSILQDGYSSSSDLTAIQSNLAFFPLYPWVVKSLGWLGLELPDGFYLTLGVVLSNLFFLAAMLLLYELGVRFFGYSDSGVKKAVLLFFAYPTSFIFSSFYPESLFLLLSILAFFFAFKEKWWAAGIVCALAVLTRMQGVLLTLALVWFYLERNKWHWKDIFKPAIVWPGLPLAAFAGFFFFLYWKTGNFLAILAVQKPWGRYHGTIWQGIWENLSGPGLDVFKIDLLLTIFFVICGLLLLKGTQPKAAGLYCLFLVVIPLTSGSLTSISRFLSLAFPIFLFLGEKLKRREFFYGLMALWFALQILYFSGWVNYYWIA